MNLVHNRRGFLKGCATSIFATMGGAEAWAKAFSDPMVGKSWGGWTKGRFQVHFIHTGVGESMFYIFPDGTTMLLDCGDHPAATRGKLAVPILPDQSRHAGEWIARYVLRVNPHGKKVDYLFLSHFHGDHSGCSRYHAGKTSGRGEDYYLSGFAQAAEFLDFKKGIDRGWPDYDEPVPLKDSDSLDNMRKLYAWLIKKGGFLMEKFKVGAVDQVRMLFNPEAYPEFSIVNVCGNGKIRLRDGGVLNLFENYAEEKVDENMMSLGQIFRYGKFKLFSAGDFAGTIPKPLTYSGKSPENLIGPEIGKVDVCKVNHHGYYSMQGGFVREVQARAYISCVWDQLHNNEYTMTNLTNPEYQKSPHLICPTVITPEKRTTDKGQPWLDMIPEELYEGSHIVLDVAPGGREYTLTYLDAKDESMRIKGVFRCETARQQGQAKHQDQSLSLEHVI